MLASTGCFTTAECINVNFLVIVRVLYITLSLNSPATRTLKSKGKKESIQILEKQKEHVCWLNHFVSFGPKSSWSKALGTSKSTIYIIVSIQTTYFRKICCQVWLRNRPEFTMAVVSGSSVRLLV